MNEVTHAIAIPLIEAPAAQAEPVDPAVLAAAFTSRAERAAALVRAGAVEALGHGRYKVRSAGGGWYAVRPGYCNCPDYAWRGLVPCKHLLAVEMARPLLAESAA